MSRRKRKVTKIQFDLLPRSAPTATIIYLLGDQLMYKVSGYSEPSSWGRFDNKTTKRRRPWPNQARPMKLPSQVECDRVCVPES